MLIIKMAKNIRCKILPQEPDALTSEKAQSASRFKKIRDIDLHTILYTLR